MILDEYSAIFLVHCYLRNFNVFVALRVRILCKKIDKKMDLMENFSILFEFLMSRFISNWISVIFKKGDFNRKI